MVHQTRKVDICLAVFLLSVHFIGPYYLNCALSRKLKSLDFFCGIRTYSEKGINRCLLKELVGSESTGKKASISVL